MIQTLDDRIVEDRLLTDRRDSRRMPQPGGFGVAEFRIGSKKKIVEVLDESAGGFMVAIDERLPAIKPSTPLEIVNNSGRHPLVLVWRRNVGKSTRLGLQRLPEHMTSQEPSWIIWMIAAIILGFCVGYVVAFRDQEGLAKDLVGLATNGNRELVNREAATAAPEITREFYRPEPRAAVPRLQEDVQ